MNSAHAPDSSMQNAPLSRKSLKRPQEGSNKKSFSKRRRIPLPEVPSDIDVEKLFKSEYSKEIESAYNIKLALTPSICQSGVFGTIQTPPSLLIAAESEEEAEKAESMMHLLLSDTVRLKQLYSLHVLTPDPEPSSPPPSPSGLDPPITHSPSDTPLITTQSDQPVTTAVPPAVGDVTSSSVSVDALSVGGTPPSSANEITEHMEILPQEVGIVLGKGGENIRILQQIHQVFMVIQRDSEVSKGEPRQLTVRGSEEQVHRAVAAVKLMISTKSTEVIGDALTSSGSSTVFEKLSVPNNRVGLIIGRGGVTLKTIMSRTRTHVQIPTEADSEDSNRRTLTITGPEEGVKICASELLAVVSGQVLTPTSAHLSDTMEIPESLIQSHIIGVNGSALFSIQAKTGAKLSIPLTPDVGTFPRIRTITIIGTTPEQVSKCVAEIQSIISEAQYAASTDTTTNPSVYPQAAAYPPTTGQWPSYPPNNNWNEYYMNYYNPVLAPVTGETKPVHTPVPMDEDSPQPLPPGEM